MDVAVRGGRASDEDSIERAFRLLRADVRVTRSDDGHELATLVLSLSGSRAEVRVCDDHGESDAPCPTIVRSDHPDAHLGVPGWALAAVDALLAEAWVRLDGARVVVRGLGADLAARQVVRGFDERGYFAASSRRERLDEDLAATDLVVVLASSDAPGPDAVVRDLADARAALVGVLLVLWPEHDVGPALHAVAQMALPDERIELRMLEVHAHGSSRGPLTEGAVRRIVLAGVVLRARSVWLRMEHLRSYVAVACGLGRPRPARTAWSSSAPDLRDDRTVYRLTPKRPDAVDLRRLATDLRPHERGYLVYLETDPFCERARAIRSLRDESGRARVAIPHGRSLLVADSPPEPSQESTETGAADTGLLLIGSVPREGNGTYSTPTRTSRPDLVREAVTWLCRLAFGDDGTTLVLGGHPTITPMIVDAAARMLPGDGRPRVYVYQSQAFAEQIPAATRALWRWTRARLVWTEADAGAANVASVREAAMSTMRSVMMSHPGLTGAVVIGGMDGAVDEARRAASLGMPVFAVERTGGAASRLCEEASSVVIPLRDDVPSALFGLFEALREMRLHPPQRR